MIKRNLEKTLNELSKGYPAITITGPRQSGKTTLAKHVFKKLPYVSLENPDTREYAQTDPRGFLNRYKEGAVFDEIQRVPDLLSYLQEIIDNDQKPGKFILTGSQQFGLLSKVTQSLAGRTAMVTLLPFALEEIYKKKKMPSLENVLFTGLYPPIHDKKLEPRMWYSNYLQTYVERDVRQLVNIKDLTTFQKFIRMCANRIGQLLNLSSLASDCGITHNTAKTWISILESSYIVFLLQPYFENFNKRLIKTPKLYFHDTGLACWLLSIKSIEELTNHSMRGHLFESMVINEMYKTRYNSGIPDFLYFWRDRSGNEIDIIIEKKGKIIPVEIKSGQTLNSDFFSGLKKWKQIAKNKSIDPALIYGGDQSLIREGIAVYSWENYRCYKL